MRSPSIVAGAGAAGVTLALVTAAAAAAVVAAGLGQGGAVAVHPGQASGPGGGGGHHAKVPVHLPLHGPHLPLHVPHGGAGVQHRGGGGQSGGVAAAHRLVAGGVTVGRGITRHLNTTNVRVCQLKSQTHILILPQDVDVDIVVARL